MTALAAGVQVTSPPSSPVTNAPSAHGPGLGAASGGGQCRPK
jgi:hypothetical protein